MSTGAGHNISSVPVGAVPPSFLVGLWPLTRVFSLSLTVFSLLTTLPVAGPFFALVVFVPLAEAAIEDDTVMKLVLLMDACAVWSKFSRRVELSCDHLT